MTNRLSELKPPSKEFPRKFVPETIDLSKWENIEPLFNDLMNRTMDSKESLETWLRDESELYAVLQEHRVRLQLAFSCSTEDKEAETAFIGFVQQIWTKIASMSHQLNLKEATCPHLEELDPYQYEIEIRDVRNSIDLFREENIPLDVEITKLVQQYRKITGSMTVNYHGEEIPLQKLANYADSNDRSVRKEAFYLMKNRWSQEADKLDSLFDELLALRLKQAENAGYNNYPTFIFRRKERFDYTPEDCLQFHDTIEKLVLPVTRTLIEERRKILGLETMRPWDTNCDPYGREPLRPFKEIEQLVQGCFNIFNRVDPVFGSQFQKMIDLGLLDLDTRKGKQIGGFQMPLPEVRLPFIFMSASGMHHNLRTLLHEGGHAFHLFAARYQPLLGYRRAPAEFAEVASMSMEVMGGEYLDEFYSPEDVARVRKKHFEQTIAKLPSIGLIDGFQHWVYTHPKHTSDERSQAWLGLLERFSSGLDWSGLEKYRKYSWHSVPHIFGMPFYFIEYGIAQLGALQIWRNSRQDKKAALRAYQSALKLGGSRPLPELFAEAEIRFDFSEQIIAPLIEEVFTEVKRLTELERK